MSFTAEDGQANQSSLDVSPLLVHFRCLCHQLLPVSSGNSGIWVSDVAVFDCSSLCGSNHPRVYQCLALRPYGRAILPHHGSSILCCCWFHHRRFYYHRRTPLPEHDAYAIWYLSRLRRRSWLGIECCYQALGKTSRCFGSYYRHGKFQQHLCQLHVPIADGASLHLGDEHV